MSNLHHVLAYVHGTSWAIDEGKLQAIMEVIDRKTGGVALSAAEVAAIRTEQKQPQQAAGYIAVIPLVGTIFPRAGNVPNISGGVSLDTFRAQLDAAVNDSSVSVIVLDVDSHGGAVTGVPETFQSVWTARKKKRVVAVANGAMSSGAYWIASAAHEIVASPSAMVGSIGVLAVHRDFSAAEESQGVKTTYITAGKFKAEGALPLTDEAAQALQAQVDMFYAMFTSDVAKGRGATVDDVRNGFGEGRSVNARDAVKLGLADSVASLDETIKRLGGGQQAKKTQYQQAFRG